MVCVRITVDFSKTHSKRLPNAYQTPIICRVAAFRYPIGVLTPMGLAGKNPSAFIPHPLSFAS
jgi:hypothetical protein